jgi:hypothetical protein
MTDRPKFPPHKGQTWVKDPVTGKRQWISKAPPTESPATEGQCTPPDGTTDGSVSKAAMPAVEELAHEELSLVPGLDDKPKTAEIRDKPGLARLIVLTVTRIHKSVAKWRGPTWLLDEDDQELWDAFAKQIVANIDYKNLPLILCALALVAMYGAKIGDDLEAHKRAPKPEGNAPPAGALQSSAGGPVLQQVPGLT